MVVDAVRTYFDATSGLTELSRKEAVAAAKALLKANGRPTAPAAEQEAMPARVGQSIQALAGELIATNEANRTAIADLVGAEVGRQLERMDIVPRAEYERVVRRVAELERRLAARHMVDRVPVAEVAVVSAAGGAVVGGEPGAGPGTAAPVLSEEVEASASGAESGSPTGSGTGSVGEGAGAAAETEAVPEAETGPASESAAEAEATDATGAEGAEGATGRRTTSRSQPRAGGKSARTRSAPKRTTKAKGSTGKGSTKK